MELADAIRARRMVRRFDDRPVPPDLVDRVLDLAVRAPSAGHSQGSSFLVLEGADDRARFWACVTDPSWDDDVGSTRWHVRQAPVVVLPLADRSAYLTRYAEPDKAYSAMADPEAWPVPYWLTDCAMAVQNLLLATTDVGLGAVLFALTHGVESAMDAFGVPVGHQPLGCVALGWPASAQVRSRSLERGRRPTAEVVHRGRFRST